LQEISLDEAAQQFANTYSTTPINKLFRIIRNIGRIYPEDEPVPPMDGK